MSPRAASRLESIGFTRVYDYVAGKADWGSFGLPLEGQRPSSTRVGAHLQTDVPTCTLDESLPAVCERVRAAGAVAVAWSSLAPASPPGARSPLAPSEARLITRWIASSSSARERMCPLMSVPTSGRRAWSTDRPALW